MISYIRAWQNVFNQMSNEQLLHFNTYIISILVIFYLQMSKSLPALKDLPKAVAEAKANESVKCGMADFRRTLHGFFSFYGGNYKISQHVVHVQSGQWQTQRAYVFSTIILLSISFETVCFSVCRRNTRKILPVGQAPPCTCMIWYAPSM